MAVALPEGEDLNEWIACNISDFYKQVYENFFLVGFVKEIDISNCEVEKNQIFFSSEHNLSENLSYSVHVPLELVLALS